MPRLIDEIGHDLFAPLIDAAPARSGWRLASWDVEQGLCVTVAKNDAWLLVELEPRDEAKPCYARTARFNVAARRQFVEGAELTPEQRGVVDQIVDLVRRREGRLPVLARESATRGSEVREITVDRALVPQGPGHYYFNPYVGCMIGCEYCYVADRADLSRALEGRAKLPWGRYVDVKINAPDVLRDELTRLPPGIVRMSPILTDPYQPLERNFRITRRCLEAMVGTRFVPVVLTRAVRIADDLELFTRFDRIAVGMSVPTDDDAVRAVFEPGGDPIDERLAVLDAFRRAGVPTIAVVQPVLPMNPERLAEKLAAVASIARIDRMYGAERVMHLYERAGRIDAAAEAFYVEVGARLRRALVQRGVEIDGLDDVTDLLARLARA